MRLVRENTEDPRVQHDLELLGRAFADDDAAVIEGTPTAAVDRAAAATGTADDVEVDRTVGGEQVVPADPIRQIDDPVVRTIVRATVHVRRFFPYYLGAAVWLIMMLAMSPRSPGGDDVGGGFAFQEDASAVTPSDRAESAFPAEPPPSFADIGATPSASGFSFDSPSGDGGFASDDSGFSDDSSFDSSAFDSGSSGFSSDTSTMIVDEPEPLRIVKSGYSSATGGTPLEQEPPSGGLPVAAVGSEPTKRSFIALSGDETILRLRLVEHPSNVGADQAKVRACTIIVEDWKPERGQSMSDEPLWQEPCVDGTRGDDGLWTFDLSSLGDPGTASGFALTPGEAAGTTFNITFEPSAVVSE